MFQPRPISKEEARFDLVMTMRRMQAVANSYRKGVHYNHDMPEIHFELMPYGRSFNMQTIMDSAKKLQEICTVLDRVFAMALGTKDVNFLFSINQMCEMAGVLMVVEENVDTVRIFLVRDTREDVVGDLSKL